MPTIPVNQESPSVFDPLFEQVMKRLRGGVPDASDIGGLTGPIGVPAGLISKIPFDQVPFRHEVLRTLLKQQQVDPEIMQAFEFAVKKNPRVTAHLDSIFQKSDLPSNALGNALSLSNGRSIISISPKTIEKMYGPKGKAGRIASVLGHELTHTGQNLWQKNDQFNEMYNRYMNTPGIGYEKNPFELGANKAGTNFAKKLYEPAGFKKLKKPDAFPQSQESIIDRVLRLFTGE